MAMAEALRTRARSSRVYWARCEKLDACRSPHKKHHRPIFYCNGERLRVLEKRDLPSSDVGASRLARIGGTARVLPGDRRLQSAVDRTRAFRQIKSGPGI